MEHDEYASLNDVQSAVTALHMTIQEFTNVFKVLEKFGTYSQVVFVQ